MEWRPVVGYEGLYEVSSCGEVRSLPNVSKARVTKVRVLKPAVDKIGYVYVCLTKDKKTKRCTVHRIVAKAFIENKGNKEQVDHIDGNKTNNNAANLRWATRSENLMNPSTHWRRSGENAIGAKRVRCIETGEVYFSASEASRSLGFKKLAVKNAIARKGKCGGYHWEYISNKEGKNEEANPLPQLQRPAI